MGYFIYLATFLFLVTTYWVDKYYLLRFYRVSPQTDLNLPNSICFNILIALLLHTCVGIWIYGNQNIFPVKISEFMFDNFFTVNEDSFFFQIIKRISAPHNLFMCAFAIVLIVVICIWIFASDFIKHLLNKFLYNKTAPQPNRILFDGKLSY